MISNASIEIARQKFERESKEFGFVFHSPFMLTDSLAAFGYVQNYGSKNGVVVCLISPPDYLRNREIVEWCKQAECFCTFVNIEPLLKEYDASYFRAMLRDWGKF